VTLNGRDRMSLEPFVRLRAKLRRIAEEDGVARIAIDRAL
jgi:hypothetical protein